MDRRIYNHRLQRARRRRRILIIKMILVLILLIALIVGAVLLFGKSKVKKELTVEAGGSMPAVTEFLEKKDLKAEVISGLDDSLDMHHVGDHVIWLKVSGREYSTVLHVKDTVAPVVTSKDIIVSDITDAAPEAFIVKIQDGTDCKVSFEKDPDPSIEGAQTVTLLVTDEGNNTTAITATLSVIKDTQAPVISGVTELTVEVGGSISYKRGVTATDNLDGEVAITIDNSQVDLNTIGVYTVVYSATDRAGNTATMETKVHVTQSQAMGEVDELEPIVMEAADKLLARILTDDMTQYEKAEKIFHYIHTNVGYYDHVKVENWIQGAYYGLVEHYGDCVVYAATSKCLLTRAGIKNMDIAKIPAETNHFWNLIDIGDGWYHFDTTRRKDGSYFFYATDEEILAYSRENNGTHNYDPADYPDIQ